MASTLDCGAGAGDGAGRSQERWTGPPRTGMEFLLGALRPFPARDSPGRLAVITPEEEDVAIYDNALVTLVLERNGQHELAGRVLEALTTLQRPDGSLPSSFELGEKAGVRHYSQSGDQAWVGYAATVYLGARADGPARDAIVAMAHGLAKFLVAHQVSRAGDPRLGLVTGGEGELDYDVDRDDVQEQVEPGPIEWVSVEHNVDAFFFLRALGRQDHQESYLAAAARIADALQTRAWNEAAGQLRRGVLQKGQDPILALDCASEPTHATRRTIPARGSRGTSRMRPAPCSRTTTSPGTTGRGSRPRTGRGSRPSGPREAPGWRSPCCGWASATGPVPSSISSSGCAARTAACPT